MAITAINILPGFKTKYYQQAKETLDALHKCSMEYTSMDNLYDMEGLERVKRDMTAHLELLGAHYARMKKYKTIGDYLEEQRKALKAETIEIILKDATSKTSTNQAEKVVYAHPNYQEKLEMVLQIKGFFIKVEIMYERYTDTLNNIRQSIALCRKDPNFKPVEDE